MTGPKLTRRTTLVAVLLSFSLVQESTAGERALAEVSAQQGPETAAKVNKSIEEPDIQRRRKLRREAAEEWTIAVRALEWGEYMTAIPALEEAADAGHRVAQYLLGQMYLNGVHVASDYGRGLSNLLNAARSWQPDAMHTMGELYEDGSQVPRDLVEAYVWFAKAAPWNSCAAQDEIRVGKLLSPEEWKQVRPRQLAPDPALFGPYDSMYGVTRKPQLVSRTKPIYPERAEAERVQGDVVVRAIIDIDGLPRDLTVVHSTHPDHGFEHAATEALTRWVYVPAELDGRPVEAYLKIVIEFRLPQPED